MKVKAVHYVQDMESEDYEFYKGLDFLLEHKVTDLGYDLTFSTEIQEFGVTEVRDLIADGRNITVSTYTIITGTRHSDADPGSGPGIRFRILDHISETWKQFFGLKVFKFSDADANPGIFFTRDPGWKKSDPGLRSRIRNTSTLDTVFVFIIMYELELNRCTVEPIVGFNPLNLLRPDYGLHVLYIGHLLYKSGFP
jgi:hypothetical protein